MRKLRIFIFWLLSLTWGLPATLAGFTGFVLCLSRGLRPKLYHGNVYFETRRKAGSLNLGPFFFLSKNYDERVKYHEAGHGIQNIIYGPLFLPLIGLTSIVWYHIFLKKYKEQLKTWNKDERNAAYEKWWVEKQASDFGRKAYFIGEGRDFKAG